MKDSKAIHENIVQESRYARGLFIWTDCDREGEHIGSEIERAAKKGNAHIQVKRAHFNNLEREYFLLSIDLISHIIHAALHPVLLDYRQAAAVNARQELDLRIGSAFTRFQTFSLQRSIGAFKEQNKVISYGRSLYRINNRSLSISNDGLRSRQMASSRELCSRTVLVN
jgi:DNA topoisomerase III